MLCLAPERLGECVFLSVHIPDTTRRRLRTASQGAIPFEACRETGSVRLGKQSKVFS